MLKKCKICGAEFNARTENGATCSPACYRKRNKIQNRIREGTKIDMSDLHTFDFISKTYATAVCTVCAEEYTPRQATQKRCKKCKGYDRMPVRTANCKTCGTEFETHRSLQMYCSSECRAIVTTQANNARITTVTTKRCECCGCSFEGNYYKKFCSPTCRRTLLKQRSEEEALAKAEAERQAELKMSELDKARRAVARVHERYGVVPTSLSKTAWLL